MTGKNDHFDDLAGDFDEKTDFDVDQQLKAQFTHNLADVPDVEVDDKTMDWETYEAMSKGEALPVPEAHSSGDVLDPAEAANPVVVKVVDRTPKEPVVVESVVAAKPESERPKKARTPIQTEDDRKKAENLYSTVVAVQPDDLKNSKPKITRSAVSQPIPNIPTHIPAPPPEPPPPDAEELKRPALSGSPPKPPKPKSRPFLLIALAIPIIALLGLIGVTSGIIHIEGFGKVEQVESKTGGAKKRALEMNKRAEAEAKKQQEAKAKQSGLIDMKYESRYVTITFTSSPADAQIRIDGKLQDGPLVVPRSPTDTYRAQVSANGCRPEVYIIPADKTRVVPFDLDRL